MTNMVSAPTFFSQWQNRNVSFSRPAVTLSTTLPPTCRIPRRRRVPVITIELVLVRPSQSAASPLQLQVAASE
jgi:hypothetical protein